MSSEIRRARIRFGRVSIYRHHGGWWIYHRAGAEAHRRLIGKDQASAEVEASLLNAQLVASAANLPLQQIVCKRFGLSTPASGASGAAGVIRAPIISLIDLRQRFLDYHENTLCSSLATVSRYRAATHYLVHFAELEHIEADQIDYLGFVQYLRSVEIAPNGHGKTARRKLRDKGVKYILDCCRGMYRFGMRHGLLPKDFENRFSNVESGRIRIRDAKPIFVFSAEDELNFLRAASPWAFPIQFLLAKTGMRPAELTHLLIEDVDLNGGWLHIQSKPELGWHTKTARGRRVPLIDAVARCLCSVIGARKSGVLFLRFKANPIARTPLLGNRASLAEISSQRHEQVRTECQRRLTRREEARIHYSVWKDAGAMPIDLVRECFIATAKSAGLSTTCPKSWRHTFATLLQEANVDLLVRQETLGHKPATSENSALGMTGVYTHTTPELQRREIERAMSLRPQSIALALKRLGEV